MSTEQAAVADPAGAHRASVLVGALVVVAGLTVVAAPLVATGARADGPTVSGTAGPPPAPGPSGHDWVSVRLLHAASGTAAGSGTASGTAASGTAAGDAAGSGAAGKGTATDGPVRDGWAGDVITGGIAVLDDLWDGRTRSVAGTATLSGGVTVTITAQRVVDTSTQPVRERGWSGSWTLRDPATGTQLTADLRDAPRRTADDTVVWTGPVRVTSGGAAQIPGRPAGTLRTAQITVVDGTPDPGDHVVRVAHAGIERWAAVHVPPDPAGTAPALFHFPGMFETPALAQAEGRLSAFADAKHYLLVIPAHEGIGWQGVPGGEDDVPADDPGFVRALTDVVVARFDADPTRLYASGMSNGGLFAQALACQGGHRFAAFATVAGSAPRVGCPVAGSSVPGGSASGGSVAGGSVVGGSVVGGSGGPGHGGSAPPRAPMLVITGTQDKIITYPEAAAGADFWAETDGCFETTVDTTLPDVDHTDGTSVVRHVYTGCPADAPVVRYDVVGGGHTWPGGISLFPASVLGAGNGDVDASELIWDFVAPFRLRP